MNIYCLRSLIIVACNVCTHCRFTHYSFTHSTYLHCTQIWRIYSLYACWLIVQYYNIPLTRLSVFNALTHLYTFSQSLCTLTAHTRWDGRMSRASISHFGRSQNSNFEGSNPDPSHTDGFRIDTCHFLAKHLALLG